MKDEAAYIMKMFLGLRFTMYSFVLDEVTATMVADPTTAVSEESGVGQWHRKNRRRSKVWGNEVYNPSRLQEHPNCTDEHAKQRMNTVRSPRCYDDKRYILADGITKRVSTSVHIYVLI